MIQTVIPYKITKNCIIYIYIIFSFKISKMDYDIAD